MHYLHEPVVNYLLQIIIHQIAWCEGDQCSSAWQMIDHKQLLHYLYQYSSVGVRLASIY